MFVYNNQWRQERTKHKVQESEFPFSPLNAEKSFFFFKLGVKLELLLHTHK